MDIYGEKIRRYG